MTMRSVNEVVISRQSTTGRLPGRLAADSSRPLQLCNQSFLLNEISGNSIESAFDRHFQQLAKHIRLV